MCHEIITCTLALAHHKSNSAVVLFIALAYHRVILLLCCLQQFFLAQSLPKMHHSSLWSKTFVAYN